MIYLSNLLLYVFENLFTPSGYYHSICYYFNESSCNYHVTHVNQPDPKNLITNPTQPNPNH